MPSLPAAMSPTTLSFEERMHRSVLSGGGPQQALTEAIAAIEEDLAPSGAMLYAFDASGKLAPRAGRLRDPFSGDVSWFEDDPCQDRAREQVDVPLVHATRLLPRRALVRSAAYREFYGRHAIDHIVCLRLNGRQHATPSMTGLFLGRGEEHGDFTSSQKRRLLGVLPALSALCRMVELEERLHRVLDGLATVADETRALFVLSASGEVLWCSGPARALFAATPRARVADLLRAAAEGTPEPASEGQRSGGVGVHLGATRELWWLDLSPLSHGGDEPLYLARLRPAHDPEAQLADRYGLTPTEAAVLACLGEGMSNAGLAEALSMSVLTAATHVKRVLSKMRVESRLQAGLIMQRARILNDAGHAFPE
jgi:DNA-binding CsgD family transcriptional regulator